MFDSLISQTLTFIAGPWAIIILLKFGIDELKKLGTFLSLRHSKTNQKHSKKTMIFSMVKYLIILAAMVLCTQGIFIYPMIPVWLFVIFTGSYYIKLWKYHGYSVLRLISAAFAIIVSAMLLRSIIWRLLGIIMSNWGGVVLTVLAVALTLYTILSKQDAKEAAEAKNPSGLRESVTRLSKIHRNNMPK
ncbi:MAG: hypothetical protein FWH10_06635 [Oscillospiraceae bacterium]|nr:hypothetical protein [Oscillospiraceae bacterium]